MKKDVVLFTELYDCYGKLLTDKEQNYFKDYYEEDLSLSEIAENNDVSRSAVQKSIKNLEDKLLDYEEKVGMMKLKKEK